MDSPGDHTSQLEFWLQQLRAGDTQGAAAARDSVIGHTLRRLEILAARMLKNYPRLRRWEQTGDVLQNALLRLHRSLRSVQPQSPREYYGLAATQIRRELIDLVRHHFGPEGEAARHHTDPQEKADPDPVQLAPANTGEPASLAEWTEFHAVADRLPEVEREVFNLLWYEGLTQVAAAALLGISERTLKSRWRNAKLALSSLLDGAELK